MEQLLKNKEFKSKMSTLSPGVKQWFINALVDLFEQESEYVIDVLEDCRHELGQTAYSFMDEAEQLRAASRMFEERRDGTGRSVSRGAPSRLSMVNENLQERRRERNRRRMVISDDDGRSPSSLSVPSLPVAVGRSPSPSARGSRSLPVTPQPGSKALEEETKAILQTMTDADAHAQRERERQQERLERIRRQKKFLAEDRTAQAMKLLEKALEMDRVLARDKERQGNMLKDKLEELKKRRGNQRATPTPTPATRDIPVIEDLENY